MTWSETLPLLDLAQRLVETRLRTERLRLAQRVQMLEQKVAAQGLPATPLVELRRTLFAPAPLEPNRIDQALVLPRKPDGVWRKRYLAVETKPGSVF